MQWGTEWRRWCRAATLTTLLVAVHLPAVAASMPACAEIDPRALPAPATCQRLFPATRVDALYAIADARIKAGDLGRAQAALGCAAAKLAPDGDTGAHYEWVRRLGVLAYRDERVSVALGHFRCALSIAEARNDRAGIAKQLKNIGSALRRDGKDHDALRTLERGLEIARQADSTEVGGLLANIADVYRDLEDFRQAEAYTRQALAAFRRTGNQAEVAHMLHGLGKLALDDHRPRAATPELEAALAALRAQGNLPYQLRVHADLALAALDEGDIGRARGQAADGLALAEAHQLTPPAELQLVAARVDRISGRSGAAEARLRATLAKGQAGPVERAALLDELSRALAQEGRQADALEMLRQAHDVDREQMRARSDRRLDFLRARFEASEQERTIGVLRQHALVLWLVVVAALAALCAISMLFLRRQQHVRLLEVETRVRYEEMLARYRRETDALSGDRDLLQDLLDSRSDAVCLLGADGRLLAANRAACGLLGIDAAGPSGPVLADLLVPEDREALAAALECMEDASAQALPVKVVDGPCLQARLSLWERGNGQVVVVLGPQAADPTARAHPAGSTQETAGTQESATEEDARRGDFRRALVELMLAVVETWERSTGTSRIELAERSRLWHVTIDDGRLRTRAMERYLSLSKLPRNPRWRDVLRTAYHVLEQCDLDAAAREGLQARLDAVLGYTRRDALV